MRSYDDLELVKITTKDRSLEEFEIRRNVFIVEQRVDPEIEFDEHESDSIHFLLLKNKLPIGCARYRWEGSDIKLERFAVLKEGRGKGYGRFIMERMLEEVLPLGPDRIFLHSQTSAAGFYGRFGFEPSGEIFDEANIDHIRMIYKGREK
ncbi:MAG: GNAT family N-acetyltransferase [Thermoplasmatota archaeon]